MRRKVNLVFQGGGVKGAAFAGLLSALESGALKESVEIVGVAGASAGALAALLYAAGYSANEIRTELDKKPISKLLGSGSPVGLTKAAYRLFRHKGVYPLREMQVWVQDLLGRKGIKKMNQLKKPCRILAANITDGEYEQYSEKSDTDAASAVVKSMSFPLFFRPYADGERKLFVDGGMLSNYPLWLFQDSEYPTVGVQLIGLPWGGADSSSGVFRYLTSLLDTMLTAHDRSGRGNPATVAHIPINVQFAKTLDFHIEDSAKERLYLLGFEAAGTFDWSSLPEGRAVVFKDKYADEILEETATNIGKLINKSTPSVKRSYGYNNVTYLIAADGSADELWTFSLRNEGSRALSMVKEEIAFDYEIEASFKDLRLNARCPTKDVLVLPVKNTRLTKTFALAFVPPIEPGEEVEVRLQLRVPEGFRNFVRGKREEVSFVQKHERGIQEASLTVRSAPGVSIPILMDELGMTSKQRLDELPDGFTVKLPLIKEGEPLDYRVVIRPGTRVASGSAATF